MVRRILTAMNEILKVPQQTIMEARNRSPLHAALLLGGAVACYVAYAAASGLFQGGGGVAMAVLKVPLIVLASVVLCIPSFYVFTALGGADYSPRELATVLAGFCATAGLILLGLMPVVWLFTISSRSLGFLVWLHLAIWAVALLFGRHYAVRATATSRARSAVGFWVVLVLLVSLQMTTVLRPVLWRAANEPLFTGERMSFFTHLGSVLDWKEPQQAPPRAATATPAR